MIVASRKPRLPPNTQGATATSQPGADAVAGEGVEFVTPVDPAAGAGVDFVALVDFTAVAGDEDFPRT